MPKDYQVQVDETVSLINKQSARTSNSCTTAVCIALNDSKVQKIILKKLNAGNVPTGIYCEPSHIFEHITVVIGFRCPDGIYCLISPTFAAHVDPLAGHVTSIEDPYFPHISLSDAGGDRVGNG